MSVGNDWYQYTSKEGGCETDVHGSRGGVSNALSSELKKEEDER
jgi:hypothetical protein